jgi:D-hexose-6-phosphate mutarotase
MAGEGLFDDLDAAVAWNPGDKTQADMNSTQAIAYKET